MLRQRHGVTQGGVLDANLLSGTYQALKLSRSEARARAIQFSWKNAAKIFEGHLVAANLSKLGIKG